MSESLIAATKRLAELESKATPSNWQPEESTVNENQAGIFHGNDISKEFVLRYMHDAWGLREKDLNLIIALRNAAPTMLEVLSQFQAGDAKILQFFLSQINVIAPRDFESEMSKADYMELEEVLVRMQKVASLMEANHA
jgi:hypothetical protein